MKIIAISGSLRAGSSNTALLRAAAALAPEGLEVVLYEGLEKLPHFNQDLDGDDPPPEIKDLRARLGAAQGVLISSPEYAHGVAGSLKNALDWIVSSGELNQKPVALINASVATIAHAALIETLTVMDARVLTGATVTVVNARQKIDGQGKVTDPGTLQALRGLLQALADAMAAG